MAETPNPIQVQKFLGGLDYPASKDTIVQTAKKHGADKDVLDALEGIPDREYDAPPAISKAISGD
jgi:hypothetical protein